LFIVKTFYAAPDRMARWPGEGQKPQFTAVNIRLDCWIKLIWCVCALPAIAAAQSEQALVRPHDISFQHEVQHAIDLAAQWLQSRQDTNGGWSTADEPAASALVLTALMGGGPGATRDISPLALARGYKFITNCAEPDGAFGKKGMTNFNTSTCMMALLAARNPQYDPLLRKARQWLIRQQLEGKIRDVNNLMAALEAISYSKDFGPPGEKYRDKMQIDLTAIQFIESCQNIAGTTRSWVSSVLSDRGGFVDKPGDSRAGVAVKADGRKVPRIYGSATCAGLLAYSYAGLKADDPRAQAAYDWLLNHFALDENPGAGQQGYYGYLNLLIQALNRYGTDQLPLKQGQTIDWRREAAMKLINLQNADGSWTNPNGRWWEDDATVATAYSVISLEILYTGL
jgi:squalene-hopene/tetraprenyl-beta-curcumene cyclase